MAHSIGKTIAELRKARGWTQVQLAEKLGVTDKAVSKWESEAGMPEITQLPTLANLFEVTLDYLMTGKTAEPQIIIMSQAELCAKNDDPSLMEDIVFNADENGKNIIDYILQYESLKVFVAYCEKYNNCTPHRYPQRDGIEVFNIIDAIRLCIISNRLDLLRGQVFALGKSGWNLIFENENELLTLLPFNTSEQFRHDDFQSQALCCLNDDIFELIICDERINEKTLSVLLGKQNNRECVWYHVFPYLIHQAYTHGKKKMLKRLLDLAASNNRYAFENINFEERDYTKHYVYTINFFYIGQHPDCHHSKAKQHGLVRILEETILLALENKDIEYAEKFNSLNGAVNDFLQIGYRRHGWGYSKKTYAYMADDHQIKICKLRAKGASEKTILEESCIYDGIIDVAQVLATNDYKFAKEMFDKYPITHWEIFLDYCEKKNWHKLLEMLENYNMPTDWLEEYLNEHKGEPVLDYADVEIYGNINQWNSEQGYKYFDSRNMKYLPPAADRYRKVPANQYLSELPDAVKAKKEELLVELKLQLSYHQTTDDITKENLLEQLNNGAFEMVIIKLCVKLESALIAKYHLKETDEDNLETMLIKWSKQSGNEDTSALLHKLRKHRNGLVHPEECKEKLSLEELKKCIDIVCEIA